jgi:hypothetical protein
MEGQFVHFPVRADVELHPETRELVDGEDSAMVGTELPGWLTAWSQRELSIVVLRDDDSRDSLAERSDAALTKGRLRVYANDHLPPHFHVIGPDDEALVDIVSQTIIEGALPRRYRQKIEAWTAANIDLIKTEWNRINPRFPVP